MSDIVVIHSLTHTADAMVQALEAAGWTTVGATLEEVQQGRDNFALLLKSHDPRVVVWDLPRPYAERWAHFQTLRALPVARGRGFVFTTPDAESLAKVAGNARAVEMREPTLNIDAVCAAVRRVWNATDPR